VIEAFFLPRNVTKKLAQCGLPPPPPLEVLAPEPADEDGAAEAAPAREDAPPALDDPPLRELPPLLEPPSLNTRCVVTERGTLGGATVGRGGAGAVLRVLGTAAVTSLPFARSDAGGACAVAFPARFCSGRIRTLFCCAAAASEPLEFTNRRSVRS